MGKNENPNILRAVGSLLTVRSGIWAGALLLVVTLAALVVYPRMMTSPGEVHTNNQTEIADTTVRFQQDILPVLERRCVVCHACYDAPCQLKLSSYEGIERGASKAPVYNPSRLTPMEPTRLFTDASTTAQWRTKGFYSVLNTKEQTGETASVNSLLISMIEHGRSHPLPQNQKLPQSINLDLDRELTCPAGEEFDKYARKNEFGGMPYGTAPLSDPEYQKLRDWALLGAPGSQTIPELTPDTLQKIQAWEGLLNGQSTKQKLAARFVYEHLFLAHLYFDDAPLGLYFRLVRSKTPTGKPVEVLHTRHPNSAPGPDAFYYRLRPITSTIVHKTHIIYPLNAARLARIKSLLFDSAWDVEVTPEYEAQNASNPFVTFAAIPARARYEFMLDNVRFFIMAFIRGPVCRGQVALNVIDDHFYVAFLDPDHDLSVTDPRYLERAKTLIKIPEDSVSPMSLLLRWKKYLSAHRGYLEYRENAYFRKDPRGRLNAMDALWAGNAYNDESFLTVFRHFDSASVVPGFVGEVPKKILVMDYPVLERIYYNLVVNFDVFGNVTHQLLTRLSMDYLRMEAEDITLGFLPAKARHDARAKWYEGAEAQLNLFLAHKMASQKRGTSIAYKTDAPITEFITKIFENFPQLSEQQDVLNRCHDEKCRSITPLNALTSTPGKFVQQMPDLVYLRVRNPVDGDQVYTIVRNKAHTNVAFIFGEEKRRRPKKDTLSIVEGFMGSYPNFFFQVTGDQLGAFVDALHAIESADDFERLVEVYGVRRSSAGFWAASDWFNTQYKRTNPVEAGLLDLNRYRNH